ncbi:MAG: hypothetical protein ACUVXG_12605 [Anaerolineae bacterium]
MRKKPAIRVAILLALCLVGTACVPEMGESSITPRPTPPGPARPSTALPTPALPTPASRPPAAIPTPPPPTPVPPTSVPMPSTPGAAPEPFILVIMHTNDVRGYTGPCG